MVHVSVCLFICLCYEKEDFYFLMNFQTARKLHMGEEGISCVKIYKFSMKFNFSISMLIKLS